MAKSAPSQHWWRSSSPSLFQHFHQRRKWKRRSGDAGGGGRPSGGCRDSMWERTAENENERTTEERGREDWSFWSWSMALPLGFSYIHTVKRFMGKKERVSEAMEDGLEDHMSGGWIITNEGLWENQTLWSQTTPTEVAPVFNSS